MTSPIPCSAVIQQVLEQLHEDLAGCRDGRVADYIPELAKADPEDLAIVLATVDGRIYSVGQAEKTFTIQSISKPFMYGLALSLLSRQHMKTKVGVEPSGDAFNAISLDPHSGIPRNPMINAGAIATAAQVWQQDPEQAETTTLAFFSAIAGRELQVDQAVYRSERETGHRNRAISHLLRNAAVIEAEPEAGLDLYFRQCSIAVTCRDLAVMAATLACQGRNPITQAQPLDAATTTSVLAVMGSCGMYDYAGQWLYDVGMPAKSGVGGGVLAVVPGRLGIAIYSPRLDAVGNSVRGVAACRQLSESLQLHLYDQNPLSQSAVSSSYRGSERRSRCWRPAAETAWLDPRRGEIVIFHAQGVLDFAAMEQLLGRIQASVAEASVMVLDLGQVIELPNACGALLLRQAKLLDQNGTALLLCRSGHPELPAGATDAMPSFPGLDQALEEAENLLLNQQNHASPPGQGVTQAPLVAGLLDQLAADHRQAIAKRLEHRHYKAGDGVMTRGEEGPHLFIVASGRFSISLPIQRNRSPLTLARLATFTTGMLFGDAAFLSGQRRMADVVADTDGGCWLLHRHDFDELRQSNPDAAIGLLTLLAMDLGQKLTLCGQQLALIEHL